VLLLYRWIIIAEYIFFVVQIYAANFSKRPKEKSVIPAFIQVPYGHLIIQLKVNHKQTFELK